MKMNETNDAIKKLTALLYILMRDHFPTGQMLNIINSTRYDTDTETCAYTNKCLENLAIEYSRRLLFNDENNQI